MKQETREDTLQEILSLEGKNFLFEMTTGYGKSRLAIEKVKQNYNNGDRILIVVHRKVHIQNWEDELKKWWGEEGYDIGFVTYMSFPKFSFPAKFKWIIFDECHHLSQRCLDAIDNYQFDGAILLSATVNRNLKYELNRHFRNLKIKSINLREAIDNGVLPDPKVYLIPLLLSTHTKISRDIRTSKSNKVVTCDPKTVWLAMKQKNTTVRMWATCYEHIRFINTQIEWYKNKFMNTRNQVYKNKWLYLCNERLKMLSDFKTGFVYKLTEELIGRRVLIFCNSIEQTKTLGNCINSKNPMSEDILKNFNEGKLNKISACNMLNEGMNLVNCEIGIYANLNSSEIIIPQRAGRLLRHPKPIIIIPYFKNTREEELVKKMLENYNPELVKTITDIREIK